MRKSTFEIIEQLTRTDPKTLSQKGLKTAEELGELSKALLPLEDAPGTTHRFKTKRDALEEVADLITNATSIAIDLGFGYDELDAELLRKTVYWDELQNRERNVKWPVPFEIHVTVNDVEVDTFRNICASLEVKPIILDLQSREGTSVLKDVMTSSPHRGTNRTAYDEMKRISDGLAEAGLTVVREKIETVPWHPAAPTTSHSRNAMPKDCYFESHLAIVTDKARLSQVREIAEQWNAHLSRNVFKKLDDGNFVIMVTYRDYMGLRELFEQYVRSLADVYRERGFDVDKEIIEFSVFDTRVSHDSSWLQA